MRNKAAIYTRLSKEDLNKGADISESLRNQESMLVKYAYEHDWEVYDIYCDEDYSGAYAGDENLRPQFNRMIKDATEHKFNIILCKSQSRFSRNMEVIEQYIHGKFGEWGIRFVSLIDNADTEVKGNKKSRQINSLVNEWYVEELSDNIRAVFHNKMNEGECLMAFAPYGYMKDPNRKNHLVIDPRTAPVVKQIFDWHAEGYGVGRISRMLNDKGIPCPRKQQEIDGRRKTLMYAPDDMGRWSATSVGDILHNQAYCGDVVQHTVEKMSYKSRKRRKLSRNEWIIIKDMHEPIVSREMFGAAQERLAAKRRATGTGRVHVLSGKVFCSCCGKPMQKNSSKGKFEYLRCRDKYSYSSKDRCQTPNIRIDTILDALSLELIEKCKNTAVENLDETMISGLLARENGTENLQKKLDNLKEELALLERRQKNLYTDRLNDIITVEEYSDWKKELAENKNQLTEQINETEQQISTLEGEEQTWEMHNRIMECLETKCVNRQIIDALVDRIEFGETDTQTGSPILKIYWAWD